MIFKNRVTDMLGVELPIIQAPMGWIARSQLASAVSNAGGMGIIETSSGRLQIRSKLLGEHNLINIIASVATGLSFDIPLDVIKNGIESLELVSGRLEPVNMSAIGRDEQVPESIFDNLANTLSTFAQQPMLVDHLLTL